MANQQPKFPHQIARSACALAIGLAALGGTSHVFAAGKTDAGSSTYKQEVAACNNGTSNQDRATCLREAGAARYEAGRGNLTDPGSAQLKENAMKRCEGLPQANRMDCEKRMNGGGVADGNARDGGIYRETVTIVPGTPSQ
ncbi:hypothetical protein J8I26_10220 [Herbaspirillum sp. LeCh32-8]|uniref:hypothetical protein n=1 Tax=Herbaspirillum sp. LeCh32-8 TaxID=2821356 RepID=UPI001AE94D76|nr:hypothetical protein [Herbaspirillum sp. LeCh32-8]MBP0598481.1 hypothetical protein [Herbaspirillum sp. LeCh32-8]